MDSDKWMDCFRKYSLGDLVEIVLNKGVRFCVDDPTCPSARLTNHDDPCFRVAGYIEGIGVGAYNYIELRPSSRQFVLPSFRVDSEAIYSIDKK